MAYNRNKNINKATAFYTLLSILFGILFGVFYSVVNQVGFLSSAFADKQIELLGYQTIIAVLIVMITPKRIWAAVNSGLFFLIANTCYYFYSFFVTGKFNFNGFIYHSCFSIGVFLLCLIVWQYKKGGWFAGLGAAIPLSVLSAESIFLIICLIQGFSWVTLINILVSVCFMIFFYTKIPSGNDTKVKTIVFHIIFTVIIALYYLWSKGIIVFNI